MSGVLWFALIIPFILAGVLLSIPSLRKMTKWWELGIPLVVTVLTVVLCQWIAIRSAVNDKEYWGHMSYTVTHEEPASYDGECSETYTCNCTTDSKGNTSCQTCTRYYHCIKSDSRSCYLTDDRGNTYRVSYSKFKEIDKRWGNHNHSYKKMTRRDSGYTTVGDKYKRPGHGGRHIVHWPGDAKSSEPIVREYTYENRLQTQSHWGKVSEEDRTLYSVFDYPSVPGGWRLQSLLTNGPFFREADQYLQYLNGYLNTNKGGYKKVRLWVLVYHNQPQESAELQRAYWKGANKNELVVMLGTNDERKITWADIMAQTDDAGSETLKINIRDTVLLKMAEGKDGYTGDLDDANMLKFVQWLGDEVQAKYTKPDFKQYDYIQVAPSMFAVILTYIIVLIVNVGAGFFVVINPWHEGNRYQRRNHYRFR